MDKESELTGTLCEEKTLTQQQFKDEADINNIIDRFVKTGDLPQVSTLPTFQNFEGIFDYHTAQNALIEAEKAFMTLPAKIRDSFDNDPQQLIEFISDESNREAAIELGIVQAPQPTGAPLTEGGNTPST
jgi:phage internal scaffolding protein